MTEDAPKSHTRPTVDPGALHYTGDPLDLWDALGDLLAAPEWHKDAACKEHPGLSFFPERGEPTDAAKAVCTGCLVKAECLQVGRAEESGIWGGTSANQRRKIRSSGHQDHAA